MYCVYPSIYADILIYTGMYQVKLINTAIDKAKTGSCLRGLPHVADPSNDIVDVLIQCMDWNIASSQSRIPEAELPELQEKAVAFWTSCSGTCLTRQAKRGSGILRRHTAFCTRSWGSSCGVIRMTPRVKDLRYVHIQASSYIV
jgi:hypothetical protein